MKLDIAEQWVAALRSGRYRQGKKVLQTPDGEFCCLGVLCELAVEAGVIDPVLWAEGTGFYAEAYAILPSEVGEWAGTGSDNPWVLEVLLSTLNDEGVTFEKIAALIERNADRI